MILSSGIATEVLPCARITKYVISKRGRACFVPETGDVDRVQNALACVQSFWRLERISENGMLQDR